MISAKSYLKRYWTPLLVSAVVLVLQFLTPHWGLGPTLLVATVVAWVAASVYSVFRSSPAWAPTSGDESDTTETTQRIVKLVDDVNLLVGEELQVLRSTLEQIQGLAGDAVKTLGKSFNRLNDQVQAQSKLVHSTIGNMMGQTTEKDSKHVSIYEFIEEFTEVIQYFINLTEDVRRQRRDIIDHFEEMANHIDSTSDLLAETETTEGRDGEIRRQVKSVEHCLADARRSLGEMSAWDSDMNLATLAKGRIDITQDQLKQINAFISENLDVLSGEISTGVGMAVRSLQFEDIVSQLVNNASIRLETMGALIGKLKAKVGRLKVVGTGSDLDAMQVVHDIQSDVSIFLEGLHAARKKPVQQTSVSEGTAELF